MEKLRNFVQEHPGKTTVAAAVAGLALFLKFGGESLPSTDSGQEDGSKSVNTKFFNPDHLRDGIPANLESGQSNDEAPKPVASYGQTSLYRGSEGDYSISTSSSTERAEAIEVTKKIIYFDKFGPNKDLGLFRAERIFLNNGTIEFRVNLVNSNDLQIDYRQIAGCYVVDGSDKYIYSRLVEGNAGGYTITFRKKS